MSGLHTRKYHRLADVFAMAWTASRDLEAALRVVFAEDDARRLRLLSKVARARADLRKAARPASKEAQRQADGLISIVREVAEAHGVSVSELIGPAQDRHIVQLRDEVSWRCRQTNASYPAIAIATGRGHHTSSIASVRRFEKRLAAEPALRERMGIGQLRLVA